MCNHVYTANYKQMPRTMGQRCPYPEVYEKARSTAANATVLALPVDDRGECIFHSREVAWKRDHDFEGHLLQLVRLLVAETEENYYDFAEFVFVGGCSGPDMLKIANTVFPQQAYFIAACFLDSLMLEDVDFRRGANFRQATFAGDLRVNNTRFGNLDFSRAEFERLVSFAKVEIVSSALFCDARFTGIGHGYAVKFEDLRFDAITSFSGAEFALAEGSVEFLRNRFEDSTDFRRTQFHCQVVFSDVFFARDTEFIDTLFGTVGSTARYRGSGVEFNRIEVPASAVLLFESTDPQQRLFNSDVQISFKEPPTGLIRFRNVNFNNIGKLYREHLTQLAVLGVVEIGPGCIKYRFQTPIRRISISESNAPLILEICQTFANYFTVSNGFNLGFEVVERDRSDICFFYFTDEDISEEIFRERLAVTEQHLWRLLSIRSEDQLLALEGPAPRARSMGKESMLINAVDGVTAMLGTFFRVGIRIALGRWEEADTKALLGAIRFNEEGAEVRSQRLHRVLIDRYTGRKLFRINIDQHAELPPMILGYPVGATNEAIDVAILTAIEVERRAVCTAFDLTKEHRVRKGSRVYWRGKLPLNNGEAYELVVAQAPDAANIDAAVLTNDLLHHWNPGTALLVGIAASADPGKVKLGDVVLGSEVYYYERVKLTPEGPRPEPKLIAADATLWANVTAVADWDGKLGVPRPDGTEARPEVHAGVIASGEKVIADIGARGQIATGHRKIVAIEMEGYGFSRAVWQSFEHVRHLDIRGICDDGSREKNDDWHQYASAAAAGFAKHFLLDRPLDPRHKGVPPRR